MDFQSIVVDLVGQLDNPAMFIKMAMPVLTITHIVENLRKVLEAAIRPGIRPTVHVLNQPEFGKQLHIVIVEDECSLEVTPTEAAGIVNLGIYIHS